MSVNRFSIISTDDEHEDDNHASVEETSRTYVPRHAQALPGRGPLQRQDICGAIVKCTTTNRYLIVLGRAANKWSFPKGHKRTDCPEGDVECMLRELYEETGHYDIPEPIRSRQLRVGRYFEVLVDEEFPVNPQDVNEIIRGEWVTHENVLSMNTNIDTSYYFRKVLTTTTDA